MKILFVFAALFSSILSSAQELTTLLVYVQNNQNKALDNVGVAITQAKSDEVVLSRTEPYLPASYQLENGKYYITVTKYGYFQKTDSIILKGTTEIITFVLQNSLSQLSLGNTISKTEAQTPGIVQIITREQIDQIGARDVMDILRTIPGLEFGVDNTNNVSIISRGIWTIEGKMITAFNGIIMNELLFGTHSWGQRFPIENIERIEILKGPASILYGGLGTYGIINIVTKTEIDFSGIKIANISGTSDQNIMRQNSTLLFNKKFGNDLTVNFSGYLGRGQRSDRNYVDYNNDSFGMDNQSALNNNQFYAQIVYKSLNIKLLRDDYHVGSRDAYGKVLVKTYTVGLPITSFEVNHELKLTKKLHLRPKFGYIKQSPFSVTDRPDPADFDSVGFAFFGNIDLNRTILGNVLEYKPDRKTTINLITNIDHDVFKNNNDTFANGVSEFSYSNFGFVGSLGYSFLGPEKINKGKALDLYLAARYDKQTFFSAFVPQVAITSIINKFHSKFLFARSFRAPIMANIIYNIVNDANRKFTLKPEFVSTLEFEFGYTKNALNNFTINAYTLSNKNTIQYQSPGPVFLDNYINGKSLGTQGIEAKGNIGFNPIKLMFSYGLYQTTRNDSFYHAPDKFSNIGAPRQKAFASITFDLDKILGINRSELSFGGIHTSSKYYYSKNDGTLSQLPSQLLLNASINFKNIRNSGLNFGFSVFNITNEKINFVQPYDGGHAPWPGPAREWVVRISYDINYN